jgi:hypothetical protein
LFVFLRIMQLLIIANLFFAGILTGLEVAAHYGFREPALALEEKPQILLRQRVVRKLRWLVPLCFFPTLLTAVALAILSANTSAFILRAIGISAMGVWIFVRIVATVKINSSSLNWNPDNPPENWRTQIGKAERFHIIGTWVTIIAWVCFLLSAGIIIT